jgi:hypothetical protein
VPRSNRIAVRSSVIAGVVVLMMIGSFVLIETRDTEPPALLAAPPSTTLAETAAPSNTIPFANRLCSLAQRFTQSIRNADTPAVARAAEAFYLEASQFTDGDFRADLEAAYRYYRDLNAVAGKGNWNPATIVKNGDGERYRRLVAGTPTGVAESRAGVRFLCRITLPEPPLVPLDSTGRIADKVLRDLLEPRDRELPPSAAASTTVPPVTR